MLGIVVEDRDPIRGIDAIAQIVNQVSSNGGNMTRAPDHTKTNGFVRVLSEILRQNSVEMIVPMVSEDLQ